MEVMAVLGIISVISVGVLQVMGNNEEEVRERRLVEGVGTLMSKIQTQFATQDKYSGLTSALVGGQVPQLTLVGANLVDPWGGTIGVVPTPRGGIADYGYAISMVNLSAAACLGVVTTLAPMAIQVEVQGDVLKSARAEEIEMKTAQEACKGPAVAVRLVGG